MIRIPEDVQHEAEIGNMMIQNGYAGGTQPGWHRGKQLAEDESITVEDARVMRAWFARHIYTSRPGYLNWVDDGEPIYLLPGMKNKYRGAVSWLIWGGDSGYEWIKSDEVEDIIEKAGYGVVILPSLE